MTISTVLLLSTGTVGHGQAHANALAQAQAMPARSELQALIDELGRGRNRLELPNSAKPYSATLRLVRAQNLLIDASYGGIITDRVRSWAAGSVSVRVGSPELDNTGYVGQAGVVNFYLPLRSDPQASSRSLWRAMDSAYRSAVGAYIAKRSALARLAGEATIPDRAATPEPGTYLAWQAEDPKVLPDAPEPALEGIDREGLRMLAGELSRRFLAHPHIDNGDVFIEVEQRQFSVMRTEGLVHGSQNLRALIAVTADTQASDGMRLDHAFALHFQDALVVDDALRQRATEMVDRVLSELEALAAAPRFDEDYDGPMLFTELSSAQLLASTVAAHAGGTPAPISDYGRVLELEGRWLSVFGRAVMPNFLDLIDDPSAPGFGRYERDIDGHRATPVNLVTRGVLSGLLMGETPNRHIEASNGRDRMTTGFVHGPTISNLRLSSRRGGMSMSQLERDLLRRAREDGYDYAYVVTTLRDGNLLGGVPRDSADTYGSGTKLAMPMPTLLYRIDAQGRRELVRGAVLAPASIRVLRRIRAIGREAAAYPLRIAPGLSGGMATEIGLPNMLGATVDVEIASPAFIIDGFELVTERGEQEKLPLLEHPLRRNGSPPGDAKAPEATAPSQGQPKPES